MEAFEIIAYILCSLSPFAAFEIMKVLTEIRERVVNIETKVDALSSKVEALELSNRLEDAAYLSTRRFRLIFYSHTSLVVELGKY